MSNGVNYANREIYISGDDNVTVSGMNDGFIKIAQNVKRITLTVTGMNAYWSYIRFENDIQTYTQTPDGILVNGSILIKGTNLQQGKGWQFYSEHSATLSSGNSEGLVKLNKYGEHDSRGYGRLIYRSGTITIKSENFIDSDTAVTVSSSNYVFAVNSDGKKVSAETAATLSGGVYRDGDFIRYAEVTDGGETLTDSSTPVLELDGKRYGG
ncbi:MAG: hypothetical protein IJT73_01710 [Selenomonadaceae bacterium]|nr:hypothetical protein [Selenomonadaceae bacterium]